MAILYDPANKVIYRRGINAAWTVEDEVKFIAGLGFHSTARSVTTLARRVLFERYLYGLHRRKTGFSAEEKAGLVKTAIEIGGLPPQLIPH